MNTQNLVVAELPVEHIAMPIMDELEFRNYVSHRVRNISFERMVSWNFWHNIDTMEEKYQAALNREQAIELI